MNLQDIAIACSGTLRTSKRGVPHVLVNVEDTTYSIVWFKKTNIFRIFWPYPSDEQHKQDFDTPGKVIAFIVNQVKEKVND